MDEAVENLKVCWPFVVTCTWNSICIKLINIEEGKLIRSICCGNVRDIDIKGRQWKSQTGYDKKYAKKEQKKSNSRSLYLVNEEIQQKMERGKFKLCMSFSYVKLGFGLGGLP